MQYLLSLCLFALVVQWSVAPPVTQTKKEEKENEVEDNEEMLDIMEYRRYLREVVQVLERDESFKEKLQRADENDLRTGKIADELEFVNHNIRSKLDELKREELERLRHLARKEYNLENGVDLEHLKIAEHLDHKNDQTFEIQDLKNLIAKTTKDLAEADRRRREEFKRYEMQKQYEEQEKLKAMDEAERKKYEEELKAIKEQHKKHEPVHHPGSKQQLEEVWEKQDHMDSEDFNPRTFFYLHDVDSNGFWDQDEVKALFLKELDKLYAQGATREDLIKRTEEMERMREHVFNEADLNKDGLISYDEFLEQTKKPDFQQDEGWEGLDEQQIYTHEEFEAFEHRKQEEIQRMIANRMPPSHQGNIPAHAESFPPQYANPQGQGVVPPMHQQQYPDHGQYVQGQIPVHQQGYPNHVQGHDPVVQQQYQASQIPQQPMHGQIPNQQYHPGQMPQYQGQVPVQHQGQLPVQHQGQVPVQHQGQLPVQHQGQVPVQHHGQLPVQHQGQVPVQQQQYQQAHPAQYQQPQQHQQPQQPPKNPELHQQPQHPPVVQQQAQQQNVASQQAGTPNAVPPQVNQNQQPVQPNVQGAAGVHQNSIHSAGKP